MKLTNKSARFPWDKDDLLTRERLLRGEGQGRAVQEPPSAGPMLKCPESSVRIAFWCLYGLVAVVAIAAVVSWLRGGGE